MTQGEIGAILQTLGNVQIKLNEVAGVAVAAETRMRLIGELSESIRIKIKALAKKRDKTESDYWNCSLAYLEKAIIEVFHNKLEIQEREAIEKFRESRNKFIHGDFVGFMIEMGCKPTGRQIQTLGKRNILSKKDIKESIVSPDLLGVLEEFRKLAAEVTTILERLIRGLAD